MANCGLYENLKTVIYEKENFNSACRIAYRIGSI